jgi:hypothetical protein
LEKLCNAIGLPPDAVCVYGVRGLPWLAGNRPNSELDEFDNGYRVGNAMIQ